MSASDVGEWGNRHWIWRVSEVRFLIANRRHAMSLFCGGLRNWPYLIDLFDKISSSRHIGGAAGRET
jgi:hypothetical protein